MAYPRPRGPNPLDFDEYDATPFAGGYDQVATYGAALEPSDEICYPVSDNGHHAPGDECPYGSDIPSYLAGVGGPPSHRVDEGRPTCPQEDPPHASGGEFPPSGYGRPTPKYGSGYGGGFESQAGGFGGPGFESEYGRPKPKPAYQESEECVDEGSGGFERPESGQARPRPRPRPPAEESYGEDYGGQRLSRYGSDEGRFGGGSEGFGTGRPPRFESGYGDRPTEGENEPEESYGEDYGRRKPSRYESEEGGFGERHESGYGDRPPSGRPERFESGYGERPTFGEDEPPAPPPEEGFGGYQKDEWGEGGEHGHGFGHHGRHHHHKHHDDDE